MKLRKKAGQALLDLDDPSSEETSSYYSSDEESQELDGGLWDVDEEQEGCSEDEDASAVGGTGGAVLGSRVDASDQSCEELSSPESEEFGPKGRLRPDLVNSTEEPESEALEALEDDDEPLASAAFNPFALLADGPDEDVSDQEVDATAGAAATEASTLTVAARRRRQRRQQQRRQRRRQQRVAGRQSGQPALPPEEHEALSRPSATLGRSLSVPTVDVPVQCEACGSPDSGAETSRSPLGLGDWAASSNDYFSEDGEAEKSDGKEFEESSRAQVGAAGCGHKQEKEEEAVLGECWLCYGEGRFGCCGLAVCGGCEQGRGLSAAVNGGSVGGAAAGEFCGRSCAGCPAAAAAAGVSGCATAPACAPDARVQGSDGYGEHSCSGPHCGSSGCSSCNELVAPCKVCAGGLRFIHRRCFVQWLESSWALACPNCRTLYDSAVLDLFTEGPSVRSMLIASCPPDHDPREPFPAFSQVLFCVANMVELSMSCGGVTAVDVLRRIRLLVDDMTAHGGDGGLGLFREDGSVIELPSFNVTSLILVLPSETAALGRSLSQAALQGATPALLTDDDDDFYNDYGYSDGDDEGNVPTAEEAQRGGQRDLMWLEPMRMPAGTARRNAMAEYQRSVPPAAATRSYSFTSTSSGGQSRWPSSGSGSGAVAAIRDEFLRRILRDYRLVLQARTDLAEPANMFRSSGSGGDSAQPLAGSGPVGANPGIPLGHLEGLHDQAFLGTRSVIDRSVQRAEQQRRRAELLAQQRVQQRYSSSSRDRHASLGPPRGAGGRRR